MNLTPTPEEIQSAQKFLDFAVMRMNRLIDMNKDNEEIGFSTQELEIKEAYIRTLEYSRDKTLELFEDYKVGRIPTPYGMGA